MDAICIGEMLIDFTPGDGERTYVANPGGAPANVAISMSRNGLDVGFIGKIGQDDFGRLLVQTLKTDHVKLLCPELTDQANTTLAFVTLYENGERSFTFVRKPGADLLLDQSDVKASDLDNCHMLHAGSVGMSGQPSADAICYAMKAAANMGKLISFDINFRDRIWSFEACREQVERVIDTVDLLKISEEETGFVGGEANIPSYMKQHHIAVVVETLGSKGAKYYFQGKSGLVEGRKVRAVDATGAGDAFWGGFLSYLLLHGVTRVSEMTEETIKAALCYGNASGALCVQRMGGIPALPVREEIEAFL